MSLFFVISLLASTIGTICGIGGGIIVRPVLDALSVADVAIVSFLSSCMVLTMSLYSVLRSTVAKENIIDARRSTPLAIGAAIGGIAGSMLFSFTFSFVGNQNIIGVIQASCLGILAICTIVFTVLRKRFPSRNISNTAICLLIGLSLGIMSSFLGIGGGPMNMIAFYYFFSMDPKTSAANSIYVILISQITNVATVFITNAVPITEWLPLLAMVLGGISGGMLGRIINKRISENAVAYLFIGCMFLVVFISGFNVFQFSIS